MNSVPKFLTKKKLTFKHNSPLTLANTRKARRKTRLKIKTNNYQLD